MNYKHLGLWLWVDGWPAELAIIVNNWVQKFDLDYTTASLMTFTLVITWYFVVESLWGYHLIHTALNTHNY